MSKVKVTAEGAREVPISDFIPALKRFMTASAALALHNSTENLARRDVAQSECVDAERAAYLSGVRAGIEAAAQWHEYLKAECDDLIGDDETPATMIAAMMVGFHNGAIDGIRAIDPESVGREP